MEDMPDATLRIWGHRAPRFLEAVGHGCIGLAIVAVVVSIARVVASPSGTSRVLDLLAVLAMAVGAVAILASRVLRAVFDPGAEPGPLDRLVTSRIGAWSLVLLGLGCGGMGLYGWRFAVELGTSSSYTTIQAAALVTLGVTLVASVLLLHRLWRETAERLPEGGDPSLRSKRRMQWIGPPWFVGVGIVLTCVGLAGTSVGRDAGRTALMGLGSVMLLVGVLMVLQGGWLFVLERRARSRRSG